MRNYIADSVNQYVHNVQTVMPEFARRIQDKYEEIKSSAIVNSIKNIKYKLNSIWETDTIRYIPDIIGCQQAPNTMRRWIMAEPDLRSRYQNDGLSAWDKQYIDKHPEQGIGKAHYDYRRVTDGVVLADEEGNTYHSNYLEHYENSSDVLNILQKNAILATWRTIREAIDSEDNRDPTGLYNETL